MTMDAQVLAAWVSVFGNIIATLIAALVAAVIGKEFADREKLKKKLETAAQDISFLLAVEKLHTGVNGEKLGMRRKAKELGLSWSGQFIPSRLSRYSKD